MSSSISQYSPLLQGLLAKAPAGVNPFTWYGEQFAASLSPKIASWSKPLFILVGIVFILNTPATLWAIWTKLRTEGGMPLWRMRDHRSGSRYVCLNSTNVFLVGHLCTCICFAIYSFLHLYDYQKPGRAWMDLSWATLVWIAPYTAILMTSIGVCYGILVAPSPMVYAKRTASGELVPRKGPLSGLPCWILNSFVVAAPLALLVTVLPPAIKLTMAVKRQELHAVGLWEQIETMAQQYNENVVPSLTQQGKLLEGLVVAQQQTKESIRYWRPCFGLWTGWCFLAVLISIPTFLAVYRVTRMRINLAQRNFGPDTVDSGVMELDDFRKSSNGRAGNTQHAAIAQAKSEHYHLCIQFASASVLLLAAGAALLVDVILGWQVHTNPTLLATALLIPIMSYTLQASVALVLIIIRMVQASKGEASAVTSQTVPKGMRGMRGSSHTRMDSDFSTMSEVKKASFFSPLTSTQAVHSGQVVVSALQKDAFPVSPSVVHQINISQTVQVEVLEEEKNSLDLDGSTESFERPKFSIFAPAAKSETSSDDRALL